MYDVVVVGGGFAGATALREATRQGYRSVLLEARDRLGGRAWFKPDALAGLSLEMGCQFFNTAYPYVYGEIQRYGVPYHLYRGGLDGTHWIRRDGTVHEGGAPLGSEHVSELEDLLVELRRLADRIDLTLPWAEQFPGEEGLAWDISVDEWLVSQGMSAEVREVVSLALAPWLVSVDSERSLLYLARMVAADGGVYRYLSGDNVILENGTTDLVGRIAADGGGEIRLDSPVTAVEQHHDDVVAHTPQGEVRGTVLIWAATLAVLPHTSFTPPVDQRRLEAAKSRAGGEGSKIWALVRGVPDAFWGLGPVERLHSVVRADELPDGTAVVIGFGAGTNWLDGEDSAAVQEELRRWFPGAEVIASTGHHWLNDPWTRNASPFPLPGDATSCDVVLSKPDGRIFFAGSDTSLTRPGFVDGAIETGYRAVQQVNEFLEHEVTA